MVTTNWQDNDTLLLNAGAISVEFPVGAANQLILCARMNPWDRFIAMLEKKTDATTWPELKTYLDSLDKQTAWKAKESFARQSTREND